MSPTSPNSTPSTPRVTVVLAAYNEERLVGRAIASIRAQTYEDWELILVDDGSTDTTPEVLAENARKDARIRVLRNARNLGLAASLNVGWRAGHGDLIARMDADDESLPDRLGRQVSFLDAHPDVDVLGTAVALVNEDEMLLGEARRPADHAELASRMFKESPFFHPTVMLRRRVYELLGGYDERLRGGGEDLDLWLRAYRSFEFHNLQEVLLRYRVRQHQRVRFLLWNAYALARAAWRQGVFFTRGWYALRFLVATLLARVGLRRLHFD